MRALLIVLLLALAVALQSSFFPFIRLYSGQPNLIFLFVVAWAFDADWGEAFAWALVGGLFQDLLSVAPLGTSILPLCIAVFAVKMAYTQVKGVSLLIYIGVILVGTLLAQIVLFVMLGVTGYTIDLVPTVRYFMLPSLAYQLVLTVPAYLICRWLNRLTTRRRGVGMVS